MKIFGVQFDIAWEDKAKNFEAVRHLLAQMAPPKGSLVALPEMFATGFSMNTVVTAEDYGGATEQFLAQTARQWSIYLVGGAGMRGRDGRARNKALVFSPTGELLAYYAKMRLFTPGGESEHYVAGERAVTFRWDDVTVAPFVCYDLRFPEIFRAPTATHRPELFIVIASWPNPRINHWLVLLQARAIENQAYVLGVNRIGNDPHLTYPGRSVIVDPRGKILADAESSQSVVSAELDLGALREYRKELPFLEQLKA